MAESTDVEDAARSFSLIEAGCVAYACTAASFTCGVGYDSEIIKRIEAVSGSPATTTSTAVVAALQKLGVRKLAVAAAQLGRPVRSSQAVNGQFSTTEIYLQYPNKASS